MRKMKQQPTQLLSFALLHWLLQLQFHPAQGLLSFHHHHHQPPLFNTQFGRRQLRLLPPTPPSTFDHGKRMSPAFVSIGLGPEKPEKQDEEEEVKELVAGIDYEIPNHEEYRTSRRSQLDEQCDVWFQSLLHGKEAGCLQYNKNDNNDDDDDDDGNGNVTAAQYARDILTTPVPLMNEYILPVDDPDYTPYVTTKLPWTPLVPAYGLEEFGLPIPRRNAETWRHFDVIGMIQQDYSLDISSGTNCPILTKEQVMKYQTILETKGIWLHNKDCEARLIYIDGKFCSQLSKTTNWAYNLGQEMKNDDPKQDDENDHDDMSTTQVIPTNIIPLLKRLTDGFTDELAIPVPCNDELLLSYRNLSKPNHNIGDPTSQFAINVQQGTACFAALNTIKTEAVAYIHAPKQTQHNNHTTTTTTTTNHENNVEDKDQDNTMMMMAQPTTIKPVLIVNAATRTGGVVVVNDDDDDNNNNDDKGVAYHPRNLGGSRRWSTTVSRTILC